MLKKLTDIANIILNQRIEKGEKINNSVKNNVEAELYSAYNNILTILKNDTTSIGTALIRLEIAAISGRTDDLTKVGNDIATVILEKNATHNYQELNVSKNTYISTATVGIAGLAINNHIGKIFNNEFKDNLNGLIDDAKTGDKEAIQSTFWIERTTKYMANVDINDLTDMQKRGILAHLLRLKSFSNIPAAQDLIKSIGNECKFDIFEQNGEISTEKLEKEADKEFKKVKPGLVFNVQKMEELNEEQRSNYKFIESQGKRIREDEISADKMQKEAEKEPEKIQIKKDINKAFKSKMPEMIDNLINQNKSNDLMQKIIRERIEICNSMNDSNSNKDEYLKQTLYLSQRYKDINKLNSIDKKVKEELFESNKENKNIYKKYFDEGPEF